MFAVLEVFFGWGSKVLHDEAQLFLLIIPCKQRISQVKLGQQTAKTPYIDGEVILGSQYDFRRPIKPGLDIQKVGLVYEHTGSEVNDFDAYFGLMLHEDVLRFEVTVDDSQFLEEGEGGEELYGEGADIVEIEGFEVVGLDELVEVGGEEFGDDADVFAEDDEVLYAQQVLPVLYILFLYLHQDVDLVEGQLHVLSPCTHDLHCHCLTVLVVECLHHLPEGSPAKPLEEFIAVSYLFMLLPDVPALQVILANPSADAHIVDSLLIDEFDALIFGEHGFESLQYLFAGESREGAPKMFEVQQLRLLYEGYFLLDFLEILRTILMDSAALLICLYLAIARLLSSGHLPVRPHRVY